MTLFHNPLGIKIPKQIYPSGSSFSTQPKKVELWLNSLPKAHLGETSRQIYSALLEINRIQMVPTKRVELLTLLMPSIRYVMRALKAHYVGKSFPLTGKNRKVADLAREINSECAIGFKIVVENIVTTDDVPPQNKLIGLSIYNAINSLGDILLHSYQIYETCPDSVWLEIHTLYKYAARHQLHTSRLPVEQGEAGDTIGDLYKRILLVALVNPYQLAQGEVEKTVQILKAWTPLCNLIRPIDPQHPHGYFAVDLTRDEPPAYLAYRNPCKEECLVLDAENLTKHLRNYWLSIKKRQELPPPGVSSDTLKRLLRGLGLLARRGFTRRGRTKRLHVTVGLLATHRFIRKLTEKQRAPSHPRNSDKSTGLGSNTQESSLAQFYSMPVTHADSRNSQPETWDLSYVAPKSGTKGVDTLSGANVESAGGPQLFSVTNESAGGYCLLGKQDGAMSTHVGDVICIHEGDPRQSANHSICAVRWMKNIGEMMVLGIEILAPCAEAIYTRNESATGQFLESLLLPSIPAINRSASIITQSLCNEGDLLTLRTTAGLKRVVLTHSQEVSSGFRQFEFLSADEAPAQHEALNFDTIWASL